MTQKKIIQFTHTHTKEKRRLDISVAWLTLKSKRAACTVISQLILQDSRAVSWRRWTPALQTPYTWRKKLELIIPSSRQCEWNFVGCQALC